VTGQILSGARDETHFNQQRVAIELRQKVAIANSRAIRGVANVLKQLTAMPTDAHRRWPCSNKTRRKSQMFHTRAI